jgi:hypothetical protein
MTFFLSHHVRLDQKNVMTSYLVMFTSHVEPLLSFERERISARQTRSFTYTIYYDATPVVAIPC